MKVFKAIEGFPLYSVTPAGRVISMHSGAEVELRQLTLPNGYKQVTLCHEGSRRPVSVHRLVALSFVPNPDQLPCVNHKNGVKSDNFDSNLEWVTQSANVLHGYAIGLRVIDESHRQRAVELGRRKRAFEPAIVRSIRSEFSGKRGQLTALGLKHSVHRSVIADIVNRKTYGEVL